MSHRRFANILSIGLSLLLGLFILLSMIPHAPDEPDRQNVKPVAEKAQPDAKEMPDKPVVTAYLLPPPPAAPAQALALAQTPAQTPAQTQAPSVVAAAPTKPTPPASKPEPAAPTPPAPLSKAAEPPQPAPAPARTEKPASQPTSVIRPEPKRAPVSKPKSALKPVVKPRYETPAAQAPERIATVAPGNIREGRAMLRILEHGVGPVIEIAWPKSSDRRAKLYSYFVNCLGMTTAVINDAGDLFRNADARNQRWELNLDRSSGFLRQPSGHFSSAEARELKEIKQRHSRQQNANPVRIFPRKVDAYLLGGLQSVIGPGYKNKQAIRARYQLDGTRLLLTNIEADAHRLDGMIDLGAVSRCRTRIG